MRSRDHDSAAIFGRKVIDWKDKVHQHGIVGERVTTRVKILKLLIIMQLLRYLSRENLDELKCTQRGSKNSKKERLEIQSIDEKEEDGIRSYDSNALGAKRASTNMFKGLESNKPSNDEVLLSNA